MFNFWTKLYLYDNSPRNFLWMSCNLMGVCEYPSPPKPPPGNQRWQCQGEVSSVRQFLEQITSSDVQIKTWSPYSFTCNHTRIFYIVKTRKIKVKPNFWFSTYVIIDKPITFKLVLYFNLLLNIHLQISFSFFFFDRRLSVESV